MRSMRSATVLALFVLGLLVIPCSAAAEPAAPPAKRTIDFRVVDGKTQQALPADSVELKAHWGGDEVPIEPGADGHFRVEYPADTKYLTLAVNADKGNFVPMRVTWGSGRAAVTIPDQYTLALEPGTKIGGRVIDEDGKGVEGATVMLHVMKKMPKPEERTEVVYVPVTTGPDGRWSFDRAPAEFDSINLGTYHLKYALAAFYPMQAFQPLSALRDGTATLKLERGVPVEGVVYAPDGKPAAGASVGVGSDRVASNVTPEFKTDENGRFSFGAKPDDMVVVTVKAKGCAPEQKQFLPGDKSKKHELEFRLQPGRTLRGRVVDAAGKPIEGVTVYTDTWRGTRTLGQRLTTDAEGRFAWDGAPADAVLLDIFKMGYADLRRAPATATDKEVVFTLRQPLKVRGEVVDAETGKPVESFAVINGIAFENQPVHWQRRESGAVARAAAAASKARRAGTFEFELGYPYPGYAVRIEADGYLPADSRVFKMDEGEVALKFELKKGKGLSGVVRAPDGKPAAGAKLVVATPSQNAYIVNGQEVRDQGCVTATTYEDGHYKLPPQTGTYLLVVIHDSGYAEATPEQLEKSQDVALAAWGRVEGTAKIGPNPAAEADLRVSYVDERYEPNMPRVYHQVETKADAQGKFTFPRVHAGEVWVSRTVRTPSGGGGWMVSPAQTALATIEPGKTAAVQIGGTGRPVVGRVNLPKEITQAGGWLYAMNSLMTKAEYPKLDVPDNVKEMAPEDRQKWHDEFMKTDAGKAYQAELKKVQKAHRQYAVVAQPDGAFRADDIPAGTYTLMISIARTRADGTCSPGDPAATASAEVVVPEMADGRSDEPLEIPTLEMKVRKTVNVGDAAPALAVKTLDGKDLTLADYKGKYVLVDFWATWCGPCVAETPHLKSAYDAFKSDDRFAMVGLSLDEKPEAPRKYAEKNGIGWTQAFLGEWSKTDVPETWGVSGIPSIFLVGPDGKVIAKDLRGPAIKTALESAMGSAKTAAGK